MPKEKPEYFRLFSPEGVGYIAWPDDPLYQLKAVADEVGFVEEEAILPLKVFLRPSTDPAPILTQHRQERRQLIRQLKEYGGKLKLQEAMAMVARLRSLVLQDYLLRRLHEATTDGKA